MRWKQGRRSSNIEDRRGRPRPRVSRRGKLGGGTILLILLAVFVFGQDPGEILNLLGGSGGTPSTPTQQPTSAPTDEAGDFVSVVLADTEDTWEALFANGGQRYRQPVLVLYTDVVESACGMGSAASGPFYCPGDSQVYLDLSFLRQLQQLGAPGDFAFAYVIAHEVGHHVQNLLGIEQEVRALRSQSSEREANALSVMLELQADCFAGVWAYYAHNDRNMLEPGDLDEGLQAAAAVGDDRLQRAAGRRVQPESFTHGSSQQRVQWFRTGFESGDVGSCDTFGQAGR